MSTLQLNLTISLATLRAARTHTAEGDIRSYLNGVYLDVTAGKVVATDGHRMLVISAPGIVHARAYDKAVMPPELRAGVIIPNDAIDAALKLYSGEYARGKRLGDVDVAVTLRWVRELDPTRADVHIIRQPEGTLAVPNGGAVGFRPLDGTFPQWRRVMPAADQLGALELSCTNWQYVADACDAFAILRNVSKKAAGQHAVRIHTRGKSPAIITDGQPDAVAVVMPMRGEIGAGALEDALAAAHADTPAPTPADVDAAA
jgi:hypothetical protein